MNCGSTFASILHNVRCFLHHLGIAFSSIDFALFVDRVFMNFRNCPFGENSICTWGSLQKSRIRRFRNCFDLSTFSNRFGIIVSIISGHVWHCFANFPDIDVCIDLCIDFNRFGSPNGSRNHPFRNLDRLRNRLFVCPPSSGRPFHQFVDVHFRHRFVHRCLMDLGWILVPCCVNVASFLMFLHYLGVAYLTIDF